MYEPQKFWVSIGVMRAGGYSSHNTFLAFAVTLSVVCTVLAGEPIDLGSRLELLVDHIFDRSG